MTTKDLPLPDGWMVFQSKKYTGSVFYFNSVTRESRWTHPLAETVRPTPIPIVSAKETVAVKSDGKVSSSSNSSSPSKRLQTRDASSSKMPLPLMSIKVPSSSASRGPKLSTSGSHAKGSPIVKAKKVSRSNSEGSLSKGRKRNKKNLSGGVSVADLKSLVCQSARGNSLIIKEKEERIKVAETTLRQLSNGKQNNPSKRPPYKRSPTKVPRRNLVPDQTEDMDVDSGDECLMQEISEAIGHLRHDVDVKMMLCEDEGQTKDVNAGRKYSDKLYIVLDTNILLGHVQFVVELRDHVFPMVGCPVLIIPWIVMKELDSLKTASSRFHSDPQDQNKTQRVDRLARKAINLLHFMFKAKHPRVRGQTVIEANEAIPGFEKESNDDCILHCCLGIERQAAGSSVVLFSHDKNLSVKAMVHNIATFERDNVIRGIKEMVLERQSALPRKNAARSYDSGLLPTQDSKQEQIQSEKKKTDGIDAKAFELQNILRDSLTYVIGQEMKSIYDDVWLEVVAIKPPWTLHDMLVLIDKHWIAVFHLIASKSLRDKARKMKEYLCNGSHITTVKEFEEFRVMAFDVCNAFLESSKYSSQMTKCATTIKNLANSIKSSTVDVPAPVVNAPAPVPTPAPIPVPTTTPTTNRQAAPQPLMKMPTNEQSNFNIQQIFEEIWANVLSCSGTIITSLGLPNGDICPLMPKIRADEAVKLMQNFMQLLTPFVSSLQWVLSIPIEQSAKDPSPLQKLLLTMSLLMYQLPSKPAPPSIEELFHFCVHGPTREILINGAHQLARVCALMAECEKYIQQRTF